MPGHRTSRREVRVSDAAKRSRDAETPRGVYPDICYMKMPLPQRLSITGMVGLAALSATHWMRENVLDPSPVLAFALGVLPNLAAAFSMPLILASLLPRSSDPSDTAQGRRTYLRILAFTRSDCSLGSSYRREAVASCSTPMTSSPRGAVRSLRIWHFAGTSTARTPSGSPDSPRCPCGRATSAASPCARPAAAGLRCASTRPSTSCRS